MSGTIPPEGRGKMMCEWREEEGERERGWRREREGGRERERERHKLTNKSTSHHLIRTLGR